MRRLDLLGAFIPNMAIRFRFAYPANTLRQRPPDYKDTARSSGNTAATVPRTVGPVDMFSRG